MTKATNLTGRTFESLTVLERKGSINGYAAWKCRCICGKEKVLTSHKLLTKNTKSCGCTRYAKLKQLNLSKRKESGEACANHLYAGYKRSAKIRNYDFKLTKADLLRISKEKCFYCDSEPLTERKLFGTYGNYLYNGLDRVDNNKGYLLDNVVPCCKVCNIAKNTMGLEDFKTWVVRVSKKLQNMGLLS